MREQVSNHTVQEAQQLSDDAESSLRDLHDRIRVCRLCHLCETRRSAVPGEGPVSAKIVFVGEGPGRQEDLEGRPFVGRAGKFLDECLQSIDLRRDQVFITNIVKCRPSESSVGWARDRKPTSEEMSACSPYLETQLELIKPELVCTLGDTAKSQAFKRFHIEDDSIGHVHGRLFLAGSMKIVPMYHPAAALYDISLRQIIMIDFQKLRRMISQTKLTSFSNPESSR